MGNETRSRRTNSRQRKKPASQEEASSFPLGDLYLDPLAYEKIIDDLSKRIVEKVAGARPVESMPTPQKPTEIDFEKLKNYFRKEILPELLEGIDGKLSSSPKEIDEIREIVTCFEDVKDLVKYLKQIEPVIYQLLEKLKGEKIVPKGTTLRTIAYNIPINAGSDITIKEGRYEDLIRLLREKCGPYLSKFLNAYEERESKSAEETLSRIYELIGKIGTGSYCAQSLYSALYVLPSSDDFSVDVNHTLVKRAKQIFDVDGSNKLHVRLKTYLDTCKKIENNELDIDYFKAIKIAFG